VFVHISAAEKAGYIHARKAAMLEVLAREASR
jgi:hypothetical protein